MLSFSDRKVKKGSLLIDSSTIDPAVSKEMAAAAEKMGAVFMDAPVSGGKYSILAETASLRMLRELIISRGFNWVVINYKKLKFLIRKSSVHI